jgi:SAM-dependent methyltransferase
MLFLKIRSRIAGTLYLTKVAIEKFIRGLYTQQHQLTSTTYFDRYPELFNEIKHISGAHDGAINILSFGCSTGEECFTLRVYFPKAKIIGVDINEGNLRKARERNEDANIHFLRSDTRTISLNGKYNIILLLSVLCRWEDTRDLESCEKIYPFKKFEETVGSLVSQLLMGGLLVIYNSNFRFEDSTHFKDFEIVETPTVADSGFVTKFDSKNNRIRTLHRTCIYRKVR